MGRSKVAVAGLCWLVLSGCLAAAGSDTGQDAADGAHVGLGVLDQALGQNAPGLREGRRLFVHETFGGNGRTCQTCHTVSTGTLDPAQIRERLEEAPNDPLFQHDALDDDGVGTSRLTREATIRITLQLPDYVTRADDPSKRTIDVFRGIPSTINTPGLDPALMVDLREPDLMSQALGAIGAHAQATVTPSDAELEAIADFQQDARRFYSSPKLYRFAHGGPPPPLPQGRTPAQKRGRRFFEDAPFSPPSKRGVCALCHSGPMLNETNAFGAQVFPVPEGSRFHPVFAGDVNQGTEDPEHPVYDLLLDDGLGNTVAIRTTDPGVLFNPDVLPPPEVIPREIFNGIFKTPQLWNVAATAPYFHDNSAEDLMAVMDQYEFFFEVDPFVGGLGVTFTEQDKRDAVAFMKLLR